jgi:FixJ family two-component response regulator
VALRPEVGFLYISGNRGNFDDSLTLEDASGNAIPFLPKPFAPIDLIRAVRSALERRRLRQR